MTSDSTGLTVGLLFLLIAGLGLTSSFGTINWGHLGVALPLCLVAIGVIGLRLARRK